MKDLNHYINCFSSLNTMKKCGKPTPHKALLLLSVIDLVERGVISDCRVPLSDALIQQFKSNTAKLLGESILFQPKISYPFFHMRSEPFWELVSPKGGKVEDVPSYSLSTLKQHIAYARIDSDLFELLKNPNVRAKPRVVLIQPTLTTNLH